MRPPDRYENPTRPPDHRDVIVAGVAFGKPKDAPGHASAVGALIAGIRARLADA